MTDYRRSVDTCVEGTLGNFPMAGMNRIPAGSQGSVPPLALLVTRPGSRSPG